MALDFLSIFVLNELGNSCLLAPTGALRGGIKKKILFFFRKTPKGGEGGLAESKISLSEKTEIFLA